MPDGHTRTTEGVCEPTALYLGREFVRSLVLPWMMHLAARGMFTCVLAYRAAVFCVSFILKHVTGKLLCIIVLLCVISRAGF